MFIQKTDECFGAGKERLMVLQQVFRVWVIYSICDEKFDERTGLDAGYYKMMNVRVGLT